MYMGDSSKSLGSGDFDDLALVQIVEVNSSIDPIISDLPIRQVKLSVQIVSVQWKCKAASKKWIEKVVNFGLNRGPWLDRVSC